MTDTQNIFTVRSDESPRIHRVGAQARPEKRAHRHCNEALCVADDCDPLRKPHRKLIHILESLDHLFPLVPMFDLGPFVHWKGNATSPMHRWLRYREAYSPALIDRLELGKRILDPFCGCGSISIGSATRDRLSLGIDLNPIATFSTKVKLRPLTSAQIKRIQQFTDRLHEITQSEIPFPIPLLSIARKVFEPNILDVVLRTRSALEAHFLSDPSSRDFVFLAWLAVLERVGSYFKEGNGIKYRNKKRQLGRYSNRPDGEWQLARFGADQTAFFMAVLRQQLEMMIADTGAWDAGNWQDQHIIDGNALNLWDIVGRNRFDSIVFSPPYANRFDYFESFKVELWFGSFVNSYEQLNALRKASMCSHLNADFRRPATSFQPLEELIALMDSDASSWRMGVPNLMRGYFHDLRTVLMQCREVMPNGRCNVVVGNSAFAGVIIPTDILTAIVGLESGFSSATLLETRHLTVAPQQRNRLRGLEKYMRETIVVLE